MDAKRRSIITKMFVTLFIFAAAITVQAKTVKAAPTVSLRYVSTYDLDFIATKPTNGNKVQLEFRKYSGTLVKREIMGYTYNGKWASSYIDYSKNVAYKFRGRYYNPRTGNYGSWSSYKYVVPQATLSGKTSTAYRGRLKLTLKRISGVKAYKIYVSTSRDSGYRLSKTVSANNSTITTYASNYVKRGRTNYVKVKPVFKNGKVGRSFYNYLAFSYVY